MNLDPAVVVEVAVAAVGLGIWLLAFWAAKVLTRPRPIPSPPGTQDFGGEESPAVVSLITGRWQLTEDAAESTLIDLAARRILEFRQPGNDPLQTTVFVRVERPNGLNRYETMLFERVKELAVGGAVPLTALTFREQAQAKGWTRRVNAAIVADARGRGLSQRRFSPAVVAALTIVAAIPSIALGLAFGLQGHRDADHDSLGGAVGAVIMTWFILGGVAAKPRGERDTPEGRAAATRWLGLKTFLRAHESFADLPPAAVAVWDRYLSYGDAVGATRVCSAVIDLGMGDRRRVWSSFGGTWRRVRVGYPSVFPRYGQKPLRLFLKAAGGLAVAVLLVRLGLEWFWLPPFVYGGYTLLGAVVDVLAPVGVTGEVLWVETWKSRSQGEDSPAVPWLHYLAVDDGTRDRTVAWACPSELAGRAAPGDTVTLTARRWTRRVLELRVDTSARTRSHHYGDENTDQLINQALHAGSPVVATAVRPAKIAPGDLVTEEEVGRVVGRVVQRNRGTVALGPMAMAEFRAGDGTALMIAVAQGGAAELAIRTHRGGTPLPGIGEEAFAAGRWVVARRGRTVVTVQQRGGGPVHQPYLVWLLGLAVNRLT